MGQEWDAQGNPVQSAPSSGMEWDANGKPIVSASAPANSSSAAVFGAGGREAPTGFFNRIGQAMNLPTSIDEAKQMAPQNGPVNIANHPVLSTLANGLIGPVGMAASMLKSYGKNLYDKAVEPPTPEEKTFNAAHPIVGPVNTGIKYLLQGPLAPVGGNAVENLAEDYGSHMNASPGHPVRAAMHGDVMGDTLGGALNLLLMGASHGASPESRLNSLTAAAGAKASMPLEHLQQSLMDTANAAGIQPHTLGDVLGVVNKFKDNVNSEYGNAIGPYANTPIFPQTISAKILALKKPYMQFTKEGRAEAKAIDNAAIEYQKPWTLGALDSQRTKLAADLASHSAKEPVARYTAERGSVALGIDNAIMDGLRETVYPQADQLAGKPAGYFEDLKQKQSSAIRLESLLNKRVEDLTGKSRETKGQPIMSRLRPGAAISAEGAPHGFISNLPNAIVPRDVLKQADKAAAKGMSTGGYVAPVSKALVMSYPARWALMQQMNAPPLVADPNAPPQ